MKIGFHNVTWAEMPQDWVHWQVSLLTIMNLRELFVWTHAFTAEMESLHKYTGYLSSTHRFYCSFHASKPHLIFHCRKDCLDACSHRTHVTRVHLEVIVHQTPAQETCDHCHNLGLSPQLLSEPAHTGWAQKMLWSAANLETVDRH